MNPVCELYGIRYPLVMGAVAATPKLGIAVSEAGGLGTIAAANATSQQLRDRIAEFRAATNSPFAVNFPIALMPPDQLEEKIRVCIEERVEAVITSAGSPKVATARLKEHGIKVAQVVATTYHAQKAAEAGVDCIIAEPVESGGYRGDNEVSMMVLIPSIRRALPDMPLVAAGAVADGHGVAAVFALGGDGVQLGTRLVATTESELPAHYHRLILAAIDTSTASAEGRVRPRVAKPEFAEQVLGEKRRIQMGQVSALIDDVAPAAEVIERIFREAAQVAAASARSLDTFSAAVSR
ncbi:MAG TPA: nitronate monooxygenase [Tepidiformaceae bacterium]|nr:nitronate monooxygenase [Tepidiformaceae bacterium]